MLTSAGPFTETAGKIVWFELPARDTQRAKELYGQLLGWQFQPYLGGGGS